MREGLVDKVEQYESRFRTDAEIRRREEEEARRIRKRAFSLAGPSLAPLPDTPAPVVDDEPPCEEDGDALADEVYQQAAARILPVIGDPVERRLAAREAVKAIREERPLTSPRDDLVILRRLDKLIAIAQANQSSPQVAGPATAAYTESPQQGSSLLDRIVGELVPRQKNPTSVKTSEAAPIEASALKGKNNARKDP